METQLKKPSTNSVGNWTPEEDEAILRYVYEKGKGDEHMMWGNLSETLLGRSGKSCRERWFNHLDPKIKRTEWSQEEQWVLFILRNQSSEKWSLISKKLMGRTDNAVKNYWNSRLKKRIDSMQHAVNQHFERKKKQKILLMTQSTETDTQVDSSKLSNDQKIELNSYMERIKSEYLQKILDQVNIQNTEYFENLACEYTLQLQLLESGQKVPELSPLQKQLASDEASRNDGVVKNPHEQISFMNKPDLIQMHLDILYKSVTFISSEKILTILEDYKTAKEEKRKEEEDRMMQQLLMKKSRGRQSTKKIQPNNTDQEMNDESKKAKDTRVAGNVDMTKDWRKESIDKSKLLNKRQPNHSITNQNHNSFSKDKSNIPTMKKVDSTSVKAILVKKTPEKTPSELDQNMEGESSDLSSSADISVKQQSKKFKKFKRCSGLRKILKKIRKQRKQSSQIEKIFQASKSQERRSASQGFVEDPFIVKVPENSKGSPEDSKNDMKIVKFNVKDSKSLKIQDKCKKVEEESRGVTTRQNALMQLKNKNISKISSCKNSIKNKKSLKKEKDTHRERTAMISQEMHFSNPHLNAPQGYFEQQQQFFPFNKYSNVTNNIENNNNYYHSNVKIHNDWKPIQYNNIENITQNFYINIEPQGGKAHLPFMDQYNQYANYKENQYEEGPEQEIPIRKQQSEITNDFVIPKKCDSPRGQNETSHPNQIPVNSPEESSRRFMNQTGQKARNGSSSLSNTRFSRKRSAGQKNGSKLYKTQSFMNQTMAQIVQGKDTELFPLVDKRKVSSSRQNDQYNHPMRQAHLSNQISQVSFGNRHLLETPSKHMNEQQQRYYQLHNTTQDNTPFCRQNSLIKTVQPGMMSQTPHNPIHVATFNLKNASPSFGPRDVDDMKMYHNTAPPVVNNDHYSHVGPISNFADVGERKDPSQMKSHISSFHNSVAATQHEQKPSAFISVQMMKGQQQVTKPTAAPAVESRRCRLPSNEFSHDFMMKMKNGDQSPKPCLKQIMGNFLSIAQEEERDNTEFAYD